MRIISGSSNAYFFGGVLIDAPNEIDINNNIKICIITHEHCDHFAGLRNLRCEIGASGFCADVINKKNNSIGLCSLIGFEFPDKKVKRIIREEDIVEGDGIRLRVLETPGHAKGAICLYEPDKKWLFSGDTVFPDMGMPRVDLPTSESKGLKESYKKLAALDIEKIYPGHGNVIEEKGYIHKLLNLIYP